MKKLYLCKFYCCYGFSKAILKLYLSRKYNSFSRPRFWKYLSFKKLPISNKVTEISTCSLSKGRTLEEQHVFLENPNVAVKKHLLDHTLNRKPIKYQYLGESGKAQNCANKIPDVDHKGMITSLNHLYTENSLWDEFPLLCGVTIRQ